MTVTFFFCFQRLFNTMLVANNEQLWFTQWETKNNVRSFSITNTGKKNVPMIIAGPITDQFQITGASYDTYIAPNQTIEYQVLFTRPRKNQKAYLWDNFQDIIILHAPTQKIDMPLRAFMKEPTEKRLWPRKLTIPVSPTERMFDLIPLPEEQEKTEIIEPQMSTGSNKVRHQHISKMDAVNVIRHLRARNSSLVSRGETDDFATLNEFQEFVTSALDEKQPTPEEEEKDFYRRIISSNNQSPRITRPKRPTDSIVESKSEPISIEKADSIVSSSSSDSDEVEVPVVKHTTEERDFYLQLVGKQPKTTKTHPPQPPATKPRRKPAVAIPQSNRSDDDDDDSSAESEDNVICYDSDYGLALSD